MLKWKTAVQLDTHTHTHIYIHFLIYIYSFKKIVVGPKREEKYFKIGRSTKRFVFIYLFIYLFILFLHSYIRVVASVREHIWLKALLMGHSVRLELTCVSTLIHFQLVIGLYRGHPLFFLDCVYLSLLYPSLIFDVFLSLCVCVCVCVCWSGFSISLTVIFSLNVREWVSWRFFCVYIWECGLKFTGNYFF